MSALILATRNEHKLRELREALPSVEIEPVPEAIELPPEVGETFAENALRKARAARAATGRAAIADDSGIEAYGLGGRPGVRSARYAGEGASDEENLIKLLDEAARVDDRRVAYVCAIALVGEDGDESLFEGRCEGTLATEPRGAGGFGYDPAFIPKDTGSGDSRTMAELAPAEKHAISHRGRAARALAEHLGLSGGRDDARARRAQQGATRDVEEQPPPYGASVGPVRSTTRISKPASAAVSIASNAALIALKLAAAAVTGSVAILSEALHSMIDLIASVIAFISVRRADEPADVEHPYGHEKVESLAASIEGMLILVGAALIVYESVRRLVIGADVESLGFGIAVIGFSAIANGGVSLFLRRQARRHRSPALAGDAAHLGTDALTSLGVLAGLVLVEATGAAAIDSAVAIVVAVVIVFAGIRILRQSTPALVDEAPPPAEMDRIEEAIARARSGAAEVVGYHKLRARTSGRHRYIDLHVQFRSGTTLERAHALAHQLRDAIESELGDAEVLIHVEPESSRRDPSDEPEPYRAG